MVMGSLIAVGLYSTLIIPKESSPEVIIPIGVVQTVLRGGSAEDVANLTLFLASDMSSYITGQCINVCGGMLT